MSSQLGGMYTILLMTLLSHFCYRADIIGCGNAHCIGGYTNIWGGCAIEGRLGSNPPVGAVTLCLQGS
jgi:hypothetical protein